MQKDNSNIIELIKYPICIFSVLIALIIGKYALGITFGNLSEVGPGGIKFTQDTKAEIADLAGKLNGALAAIEEIKKYSHANGLANPQIQSAIFEASQTVSDQTAQLAKLDSAESDAPRKSGYIWIGDFSNGWSKVKLASMTTGKPITDAPGTINPGTEYKVLGNMVVRDKCPLNNSDYFRGQKNIGTVPRGTTIRIINKPVAINREFAVQYWVEIELP